MTHLTFISAAWGVVAVVLALYVLWVLRSGAKLTKSLPAEHRRWS